MNHNYSFNWLNKSKTSSFRIFAVTNEKEINEEKFLNLCFDKSRIKLFVSWFLRKYGEQKTIKLLDELKLVGFSYATKAGTSIGIDDLCIPPRKSELLGESEKLVAYTRGQYQRGDITAVEKFQRMIDSWHQTSETLKNDVVANFERTDKLNPVYMMAFSGARGNLSQVRQLVGMRGLMSDPNGQIIDFPIRSNFREGLTLTEYIISSYGARKGIVDTALRTANAGYLTRRLVDVAQHIIVSNFDCGTKRGLVVREMKEGLKTIYSLDNRLLGRVLAMDIKIGNTILASRNTEISAPLAQVIAKNQKKVFIRSPLTCETRKSVCQLCYGWTLGQGALVAIGEAVGIIAAQSIGEPGTQLTMRTFHTGGVFSGDLTDEVIATEEGIVTYSNSIPGMLIRTAQGKIAFFTKGEGELYFAGQTQNKKYKLPPFSMLYSRQNQRVFKKDLIAQISTVLQQNKQRDDAEQKIYSDLEGAFYNGHIDLVEKFNEYRDPSFESEDWGFVWILSGKIYQHPLPISLAVKSGDYLTPLARTSQINWQISRPGILDIENLLKEKSFFKIPKDNNTSPAEQKSLNIETSVFSMALKSINYKSVGYVLSASNVHYYGKKKDHFFLETSLLNNDSTIRTNEKTYPTFFNSDEWRQDPSVFVQWFPKETHLQTGGLFEVNMLRYSDENTKQNKFNISRNDSSLTFKENSETFSLKINKVLAQNGINTAKQLSILPNLNPFKTKTKAQFPNELQTLYCNIGYIPQEWQTIKTLFLKSSKKQLVAKLNKTSKATLQLSHSKIWKKWVEHFEQTTNSNWYSQIAISYVNSQGKKTQQNFSAKTQSYWLRKTQVKVISSFENIQFFSPDEINRVSNSKLFDGETLNFVMQTEMLFTSLVNSFTEMPNFKKASRENSLTLKLHKKLIGAKVGANSLSEKLNASEKKGNFNNVTLDKIFYSFFVTRSISSTKLSLNFKINRLGSQPLNLTKVNKIETQDTNLTMYKGWVYKTFLPKDILYFTNKKLEKGKHGLNNLIFDSHSIYIRTLTCNSLITEAPTMNFITSSIKFSEINNGNSLNENHKKPSELQWIKNKKSRFYFSNMVEKNQNNTVLWLFEKIEEKNMEFGLVNKRALYKKHIENIRLNQLDKSLTMYQNYHSLVLNKQKANSFLCSQVAEPSIQPNQVFEIPFKICTKNLKYSQLLATIHNQEKDGPILANSMEQLQPSSLLKKVNNFGVSIAHNANGSALEKNTKSFFVFKKAFNFSYFLLGITTFDRFQFERSLPKVSLNLSNGSGQWQLRKKIGKQELQNINYYPLEKFVNTLNSIKKLGQMNFDIRNKVDRGFTSVEIPTLSSILLSVENNKQVFPMLFSNEFLHVPYLSLSTVEKRNYFLDSSKNARYLKNSFVFQRNYQIFSTQPFAKTAFLSPLFGEVLDVPQYSWSNMVNKNRFLILRKTDMSSFAVNLLKPLYDKPFPIIYNPSALVKYQGKIYQVTGVKISQLEQQAKMRLGEFFVYGDILNAGIAIPKSGQIVHLNKNKITIRKGQPLFLSPKAILNHYSGDFVKKGQSIITLPYERLKTGDIVQGIPKVEQFFEARTTKAGKLFRDSIPNLLKGLFKHYRRKLPIQKAVRQSFYKIQQILVDGVQRVYRSQGVSIADKHIEVIVRQMTAKVKILKGGQTGFFPGEILDLEFVEDINKFLLRKITYEPLILGITRASLEADSFLAAASFQQTTKMLSRAALYGKKDFLRGLKENVILGNLIPAGTGYLVQAEDLERRN